MGQSQQTEFWKLRQMTGGNCLCDGEEVWEGHRESCIAYTGPLVGTERLYRAANLLAGFDLEGRLGEVAGSFVAELIERCGLMDQTLEDSYAPEGLGYVNLNEIRDVLNWLLG